MKHLPTIDAATALELLAPTRDAWLRSAARGDVDGIVDFECWASSVAPRLHRGSLELDELTFPPDGPALFVAGDLVVKGLIEQQSRGGFLVVLGNLRAGSIVTSSQIVVTGDVTVEDTLYGNSTRFMTSVLGVTKARVVVCALEHCFAMYGGHELRIVVDTQGTPNLGAHPHRSVEALAMDDVDDAREAARRLRAGESLLG